MNNADYGKLTRKQLLEQMEAERQEWLELGMTEADIYRVHFGMETDKGRGGDYRTWLNERKHTRADHKYSPGTPVAIDVVDPDNAWISSGRSGLDDTEFNIDFENVLATLTKIQRACFTEIVMNDRSYTEVAKQYGKHHSTIQEAVKTVKEKLKNFFS
jgi:hypothetical protein